MKLIPVVVVLLAPVASMAAVLETPSDGSELSGALYVAGWKCPPVGEITVQFDDLPPLKVVTKVPRGDTATACGNNGDNGFIAQFNYNILNEPPAAAAASDEVNTPAARQTHTAVAYDNGVEFARSDFTVTSLGARFLTGADGAFDLPNFPSQGETTTVEWNQAVQGFLITDHDEGQQQGSLQNLLGTWNFTFTIINTFHRTYELTSLQTSQGITLAIGSSSVGGTTGAGFIEDFDDSGVIPYDYFLLDKTFIGCDIYTFDFTGPNTVAGLEFTALGSDCDTILGNGYPMTGVRVAGASSALADSGSDHVGELQAAAAEASSTPATEGAAIVDLLRAVRRALD